MTTTKISELPTLTTPADGDFLIINDTSESNVNNRTKKITVANARGSGGGTSGNDLTGAPTISGAVISFPRRSGSAYTINAPQQQIVQTPVAYTSGGTYNVGQLVTYQGRLYQARVTVTPNPNANYYGQWNTRRTASGFIQAGEWRRVSTSLLQLGRQPSVAGPLANGSTIESNEWNITGPMTVTFTPTNGTKLVFSNPSVPASARTFSTINVNSWLNVTTASLPGLATANLPDGVIRVWNQATEGATTTTTTPPTSASDALWWLLAT